MPNDTFTKLENDDFHWHGFMALLESNNQIFWLMPRADQILLPIELICSIALFGRKYNFKQNGLHTFYNLHLKQLIWISCWGFQNNKKWDSGNLGKKLSTENGFYSEKPALLKYSISLLISNKKRNYS